MKKYKQIKATRNNYDTIQQATGWIEIRGAKVGSIIELIELSNPENRWTVTHVYDMELNEDQMNEQKNYYRKAFELDI